MKGLYRRGKYYWMTYSVNGKMRYESTGVTTRREAEYILGCRRKEIREGKIPETRKIKNCKFLELAQEYDTWVKQQKAYRSKK